MNNKLFMIGIALVFVLAYGLGQWLSYQQSPSRLPRKMMTAEACDPTQTACQATFGEHSLSLIFLDKPSTLKPFRVRLESDSEKIDNLLVDFKMPGMNMGVNRHHMNYENGYWQNQLVLPVCTQSRNDWSVTLELEQEGILWTAEFYFVNQKS
ncbi:MAG: hypothetical protein ACN4GM_14260 [Gammaproteobacteria bacterium]